ncbi:MAG: c-type cytochrome [Opitutaceae bacterium]|nr:c-type cytochrome [Opitutaceae bacterium]
MRRVLSKTLRTASAWFVATLVAAAAEVQMKVAPGFEVTRVHAVTRDTEGSWVSVAADSQGRLYASDQYGPVYRITPVSRAGGAAAVARLPIPIGGVHGMTWIDGSLYAVVGQKAAAPTGLYRLRDTDGDGDLDKVELLKPLDGDGEHGPHAVIAAPDGRSLYVLAGNATKLPELVRSRVPQLWADDSLLEPLPALMGSETRGILPGGWICRTDREGRTWELVCAGFRNAYALALDVRGELFTFDSDTEFEINLPWYRPTRVLHAVSGADFGWRRGALKIPDGAPDLWPTVLPMGLGSPTAVLSTTTAKLPQPYRDALWVADWSYGKIFALRLQPRGASYGAEREEIVSGTPLPVTAMCVNPLDGAIYFTTGGRRLQSALYRLRWIGGTAAASGRSFTMAPDTVRLPDSAATATSTRHSLEAFHGRADPPAVDTAWSFLGSPDPSVRQAARAAIESQPPESWRDRALHEKQPRIALAALLALTRADAPKSQSQVLSALRRLHEGGLEADLRGEWLRVLSLAFARGGEVSADVRSSWAAAITPMFPTGRHELDVAIFELLVFCDAREVAAKGVAALRGAVTRQAQLDYAKSLRVLRATWTPDLRRQFFEWLAATTAWRGGGSFARFLDRLREDALKAAPDEERAGLRGLIDDAIKRNAAPDYASTDRKFVRAWTTDDLAMLAEKDSRKRDVGRGRALFGAAGCFACHTFNGEGGALGPDLSAAARQRSVRDLIEAIVEPSREISDQYGTVAVRLRDGRQLSGRIINLTEKGLQLAENLADPSNVARFDEQDIVAIEPSKVSLMPAGLLNVFSEDEILDLLGFMRTEGVGEQGRRE